MNVVTNQIEGVKIEKDRKSENRKREMCILELRSNVFG